MADIVSAEVRSRMMAGIRGKDTKPEIVLRKGLHAAGFRYRLHAGDIPGRWHGHDCHLFRWPKSRQEFWTAKINRNREVDARTGEALAAAGWRLGVVWECAMKGRTRLPLPAVLERCARWLRSDEPRLEIRGAV